MKLLIKETGLIAFKFKDTDTVAIDEYKLTVTETDKDSASQSWESTSHNNSMFTLVEDVTAEMYLLGTQEQADHYSYQTYESNQARR